MFEGPLGKDEVEKETTCPKFANDKNTINKRFANITVIHTEQKIFFFSNISVTAEVIYFLEIDKSAGTT